MEFDFFDLSFFLLHQYHTSNLNNNNQALIYQTTMSGIVDQVKEAVGLASHEYPAEDFQLSGKDPAILMEQQEQNVPGERPGKQTKQHKVGRSFFVCCNVGAFY